MNKVAEAVTALSLHKKVSPSCSKCGSSNIRAEAFIEFNVRLQEWKIREVLENNSVCADCGQDCEIKWRIMP